MVSPNLCVPFNLLASYTSSVLEKFIANLVNRCRFAFIRIQCSMAENSVIQLKSKREKMSKAKMKREKKHQINFECKIKRWRWMESFPTNMFIGDSKIRLNPLNDLLYDRLQKTRFRLSSLCYLLNMIIADSRWTKSKWTDFLFRFIAIVVLIETA